MASLAFATFATFATAACRASLRQQAHRWAMAGGGELHMQTHFSQQQSAAVCGSSRRWMSMSSSSRLPVAIFVDLDNVAPTTHGRDDIGALVSPLQAFGEKVGRVQTFQGFANEATRTWATEEERERRKDAVFEQEFEEWDGTVAQTGLDEDGILRCGVCGARMKLTKKDRKNGLTEETKLDRHMKMLHDREQEKRKTKMKQQKKSKKPRAKKLSEKEMEKFRKYEAAQVGLFRNPAKRIKTPKEQRGKPKPNDLFRILKEFRVKLHAVDNVDSKLIEEARRWMQGQMKRTDRDLGHDHDIDALGCLVVVSEDADFCDLLREARANDFLAVSVPSLDSDEQTRKLAADADLVLLYGGGAFDKESFGETEALGVVPRAISDRGHEFLMDVRMNSDEEYSSDDFSL